MEKYALVTGASGDIGQAICLKLAKEGYSLYIHYHQNRAGISSLSEKLNNLDVLHYIIQADFSDSIMPQNFIDQIIHPLDLIVHNSSQTNYGLFTDLTTENLQSFIHTNLTVPIFITKELLPSMIQKKHGNIIFNTSIWGLTGASCEVLYSTIKGAQNTFVKALAKELSLSGIRVNAVAPGAITTKMMKDFSEDELELIKDEIPMGRLGKPKEVADTIAFLASDNASYITGQVLSINGGWFC